MTYKATQQLSDIFLANDFNDISQKEHPNSPERRFRLNGVTVYFDPYEIHVFATCDAFQLGNEVSDEEVRAIVYLAKHNKIPSKTRTLEEEFRRALSDYRDVKERPDIFSGERATKLKERFESIAL